MKGPTCPGARPPGHRCCWQAASQVGHIANDDGATTSAIHCLPPSIRCARPHGLELPAGRPRAQQDYESFRQHLKTWLFSSY